MKRAFRLAAIAMMTFALVASVWVCVSPAAQAQVTEGLSAVAPTIRLSSADPRVIAARIINVALGLLGIIFLGLMVYAGFLYMTSGGDSGKTEKAVTLIRNAIIGLIIILSAWAITRYVIERLLEATNSGGGGGTNQTDGNQSGGGGFGSGGAFSSFQIRSITPSGQTTLRNVRVRFVFTQDVDPGLVNSALHVSSGAANAPVSGTFTVSGPVVEFIPTTACPSAPTERCFDEDTEYRASVDRTLRSQSTAGIAAQRIVCGGLAPPCEVNFRTGRIVDTQAPTTFIRSPYEGQSIARDSSIAILTRTDDDLGISYVSSSVNGRDIGVDTPTSSARSFDASVSWSTRGMATGTYQLRSSGHDLDSHVGLSQGVNVVIRPAHCFNGSRDADETDLDCGGADCGACAGGACRAATECRSGVCSAAGVCIEQPVILNFSPDNGKQGTLVTINGANFGNSPGQVRFWDGAGFGAVASPPAACAASNYWSPWQVIVPVPNGAQSGPVQIFNASSSLLDATNDRNGPTLNNYTVNNVGRPGLCGVSPSLGQRGDPITLNGAGLGNTPGRIFFADRDATPATFSTPWSSNRVSLSVPVIPGGVYPVRVVVDGVESNSVAFTVTEEARANPVITSINPGAGPIGEYVTLMGRSFGTSAGRVVFRNVATGEVGNADTNFPAACTREFWRDGMITVKVPPTVGLRTAVTLGEYQLYVVRQGDGLQSNRFPFTVNTNPAAPGICSVAPVAGPVGTVIAINGERLGGSADTLSFQGATPEARVNASTIAAWTNSSITATVPTGAYTGPVRVAVGSMVSNGVNFAVRNCNEDANMCGASESCCRESGQCSVRGVCAETTASSMYAWQMSTGLLPIYPEVIEECSGRASLPPSPSPWNNRAGGNEVCVNAEIAVRFNTALNHTTLRTGTKPTVIVSRCTATGDNPCATKEPVSGRLELGYSEASDGVPRRSLFTFAPNGNQWSISSTYEVALTTGILSEGRIAMRPSERCGEGVGYCFRFRTRASPQPCRIASASLTPHPYTATDIGERVSYRANLLSEDQCIQVNPASTNLSWRWFTGRSQSVPDARATLASYTGGDCPATGCPWRQTATAQNETGPNDPVRVNVRAANATENPVTARGDLYIRFVPPRVTSYGPNCNEACTEAKIWAEFNVPMDESYATERQILLYKCENENCRSFSPSTPLVLTPGSVRLIAARGSVSSPGARRIEIEPVDRLGASYLEPGAFYKVILRGDTDPSQNQGFRSQTGLPLTDLNNQLGFAWRFRVKEANGGVCDITRVDVVPIEKVETVVGARELFAADPVSNSQVCGDQILMSRASYSWNTQFADVSRFLNGRGTGFVDTNPVLPANCSGRCLNIGAEGVDGRIASCGNSLVETTDASSCRRPDGGNCRPEDTGCVLRLDPAQRCRVLPPGSRGGEECDLGSGSSGGLNGVRGSLCNAACLWAGVEGGSCGNGVVNPGEQCDPGRTCVGGSRVGEACTTNDTCGADGRCEVREANGCSARCLALGSAAVSTSGEDSQCGNRSLGAGETCDDGNLSNGDGCSAQCLHEGSRPVVAICGNGGAPEPGESCEKNSDGGWPSGCNRTSCLNEGTQACTASTSPSGTALCCGNGMVDSGEDCDDGNTTGRDGCSNRCLAEGSSIGYLPTASFCGDGIRGVGEQCEAERGDGFIDNRQLSEIVGTHEPDANGLMMSRVRATYRAQSGEGSHGLQCGFREEMSCANLAAGRTVTTHGLTSSGCCMERPRVTEDRFPRPPTAVCRNTEISFPFNQLMDEGSVRDNFFIAEEPATGACPAGTSASVRAFPRACIGGVSGTLRFDQVANTTRVVFSLQRALKANTTYRVIVRGDEDVTDPVRAGVRNMRGTVMAGNVSWTFTTSERICAANDISLRDTYTDRPYLFQAAQERHAYVAGVVSVQNGIRVPISSVEEYGWTWEPWISSDPRVLTIGATETSPVQTTATSTIQAQNRNGSSLIFAGIRIGRDTINVPSTVGRTVESARLSRLSVCERPWPAADARYTGAWEFSDSQPQGAEPNVLRGTIFQNGPYYNFSTLYCMDEGRAGVVTDDLPSLTIRPTPPSATDASRGLLRQYLFTFDGTGVADALRKDAIGIRIFANPLHLSPRAWYAAQGFEGSPQAMTVDGYEAIRDGSTVYVAAPNAEASTQGPVTSTIYILSRNPDAEESTQAIFDQLLENWTFNVNLRNDSSNTCKTPTGQVFVRDGRTVPCTSDWECSAYGDALYCAAFKAKIQRDGKRLADFQSLMSKLETVRARDGRYPAVTDGSYLQGITNSRWGSWQAVLGSALGGDLPVDPVNRFLTCGRCQYTNVTTPGEPCTDTSDCRAGGRCVGIPRAAGSNAAYDPATCWEPTNRRFICPRLPSGPSRVYQYQALGDGSAYELRTILEAVSYDRYRPQLTSGLRRCSNTGQLCQNDNQCITYYPDTSRERSRGSCQATGGQWRYDDVNFCNGREFGIDAVCGNGVRSSTERCETGDTATTACETADGRTGMKQQVCAPDCQSFIDGPVTQCLPVSMCGNGRVDRYVCSGSGAKFGQSCTTLSADGTSSPECTDARDPAGTLMRCVSVRSLPRVQAEEVCDDGALNGTYGRCNRTCTGYDAQCGDGELSAGETCDLGRDNGLYCDTRSTADGGAACVVQSSCGIDCRTRAPFCGDGTVQAESGEQCEPGTSETTLDAVCTQGPFAGARKACRNDVDCDSGTVRGRCGHIGNSTNPPADNHYPEDACEGYMARRCIGTGNVCENAPDRRACRSDDDCQVSGVGGRCVPRFQVDCSVNVNCGVGGRCNAYPTRRVRTCGPLDADAASDRVAQCQWGRWSACLPAATCGDGVQDAGEECDDGNESNNDRCTTQCRLNVCGDNYLQTGVEQCDYGNPAAGGRNGQTCSSEYGASCASCSLTCRVQAQSGGFCGNGIQDGREQCDSVGRCVGGAAPGGRCTANRDCGDAGRCEYPGVASNLTCQSIGYDYANRAICDTRLYITNRDGSLVCVNTGSSSDCVTCSLNEGNGPSISGVRIAGGACQPCRDGACVYHEAATGQSVNAATQSACRPETIREELTCSTSCGFAGCGSCLAQPTAENATRIEGDVYDQLAGVIIPGARVVLTYRGNTIADTVTNANGRFTIPNLHGRRECGQYRLVVSFERDNPRTTSVERFGYRAFDSGVFSPVDFTNRVTNGGRIDLAPRVGENDTGASTGGILPGETRIIVTWNGRLPVMSIPGVNGSFVRAILPHLIVPTSRSYVKQPTRFGNSYVCGGSSIAYCSETSGFNPSTFQCDLYSTNGSGGSRFICGFENATRQFTPCCLPTPAGDAAVARWLSSQRPPVPATPENVASYRTIACCAGSITEGADGILLGYGTSTSCGTASACSSNAPADAMCCRRDVGTPRTWQGFPEVSSRSLAPAVTTCAPHKITTQAFCEQLRAGTVLGLRAEAQGVNGPLTQLACTDNTSCDEYVREATPAAPMLVRYFRSNIAGENYQFYLQQGNYAERELDPPAASSPPSGGGGGQSASVTRCYAGATATPGGRLYTDGPCGFDSTSRRVSCTEFITGAGNSLSCLESSRPPNEIAITCATGFEDCVGLTQSRLPVQITISQYQPTSGLGVGNGSTPPSSTPSGGLRSTLSTPAQFMSQQIRLQVRVLSGTQSLTITPPAAAGITCPNGNPYLWLAFEQNAQTGVITIPNSGAGRFVCDPPAGMTGIVSSVVSGSYNALGPPALPRPELAP